MNRTVKRILPFLIAVLICYVGWRSGSYLSHLPYFEVKNIEVKGNKRLTAEHVRQLSGINSDQNIFTVDLQQVSQNLYAHPYIKRAMIERKFPQTVKIKVMERQGVALLKASGTYYLLDEEGMVLENVGWRNRKRRSVFEGLGSQQVQIGKQIQKGRKLLGFLSSKNLLGDFARVNLADPAGPVLTTRREGIRVYLGQEDWDKKMTRFNVVYEGLRARSTLVKTVDLRYGHMVVVKPALKS